VLGSVASAVFLALFSYRFDYAAHLIAGFGLCLVLLGVAWRRGFSGTSAVVGAVVLTFVISIVVELVEPGAIGDTADVANAVIGASLATAPWIDRQETPSIWRPAVVVGAAAVVLAFVVRYPVGSLVEGWWG
jgi:hypothetical protein